MQSSERTQRSKRRLNRLTAEQQPEPGAEDEVRRGSAAAEPGLAETVVADPARGWRGRWLPVRWQGARVDPGRHGALALAGVAAVAAVIAAAGVWRDRPVVQPVPPLPAVSLAPLASEQPSTGSAATTTSGPHTLVVSVAGRVNNPGLVTVPPGARIADALAAAGGVVPGTDLVTLNLAQPLDDGQQILVGVAAPAGAGAVSGGSAAAAAPGSAAGAGVGLVNLNSATATALEALPGVGPVMDKAILDWRTKNGSFRRVEQLSEVSGIGPARLAQLRELVTV